jgi:hypothetical protein
MNQKTHEPGAGDANWDPSYNSWIQCVHPCCSRCSGEQDDDPDHDAAGADSSPEWVKSAELATATKSRVQATKEDHEQQAQKEPQENQHHGGESPQPKARTTPQKSKQDHEQAAVHDEARTPCGAEIKTHRCVETPSPSAPSDNTGRCHKP